MPLYKLTGFVLDPLTNQICLSLSGEGKNDSSFFQLGDAVSDLYAVPSASCKADFSDFNAGDLVQVQLGGPTSTSSFKGLPLERCYVLDRIRKAESR